MSGAARLWFAAGLLAALCGAAAAARAQPAADDPIARGVELRRQGKNAEALVEFERAYAQSPSPRALAQIALAQHALGHWVEAEQGLSRALAAEDDAWIAPHLATLRAALATVRDHLASLHIETDVEGATIWISGAPIGTAPLASAVRVPAGEIHIEARAEGRTPASVTLTLAPHAEEHVRLALPVQAPPHPGEPAKAAQPVPAVSPAAAALPERTAPSPAPRPATPQAPPDAGSGARTGAVIAFVVGGVLLAGAITANVIRENDRENLNDPKYCNEKYDCSRVYERAQTAETLFIIGYAAAGAAVATGVVLWLIAPDPADDGRAALGVGIDSHGGPRILLRGAL